MKITGNRYVLLILLTSISVIGISGHVYEFATQRVSQNIINVVSLDLSAQSLGSLREGETRTLTKDDVPSLGDAIRVSVDDSVSAVILNLDSNLDDVSDYYSLYDVVVRFSQVVGGSYSVGEVACTLSIRREDYSSVELDHSGVWMFDLEISTNAKSVNEDTPTAVTITVSVEEI